MKLVCEDKDLKVNDDGDSSSIFSLAGSECSISSSGDRYQSVHQKRDAPYVNLPKPPMPSMMCNSQIYLGTLDTDAALTFQGFQQKEANIYSLPERAKRRRPNGSKWYRALCVLLLALNFTASTVLVLQLFFQHKLICKDLLTRDDAISDCSCLACHENTTHTPDTVHTETSSHKTPHTTTCMFDSACARGTYYVPKAKGKCESLQELDLIKMTAEDSPSPHQTRRPLYMNYNSSMAVGTTGWFLVHSRLSFNQQCSFVCRGSQHKGINHTVSVYRMNDPNDSSKDQRFTLMSESRLCCNNCTEPYGVSELSVVYELRRNDFIYVETSGISLIDTKGKVSFLEAAFLAEGKDGYRIYKSDGDNPVQRK
ncbi:hypothetical protein Btru_031163 [Bulinus truncatus]|nr:hypothetical protein Btru_031163 [Bulinus truncatus]